MQLTFYNKKRVKRYEHRKCVNLTRLSQTEGSTDKLVRLEKRVKINNKSNKRRKKNLLKHTVSDYVT